MPSKSLEHLRKSPKPSEDLIGFSKISDVFTSHESGLLHLDLDLVGQSTWIKLMFCITQISRECEMQIIRHT